MKTKLYETKDGRYISRGFIRITYDISKDNIIDAICDILNSNKKPTVKNVKDEIRLEFQTNGDIAPFENVWNHGNNQKREDVEKIAKELFPEFFPMENYGLKAGDKVKLKSNGKVYDVVGFFNTSRHTPTVTIRPENAPESFKASFNHLLEEVEKV